MNQLFALEILFLSGFISHATCTQVSLTDNGYNDILVAINPEIPEDPVLLESLKSVWTDASRSLYIATGRRAYFRSVKILVPESWKNGSYSSARSGESFSSADVLIANPNPQYLDIPYTLQYGDCGQPGLYIHLTPNYTKEDQYIHDTGAKGKVLVHEWAHYRWGVFDERATDGYPAFYVENANITATKCSSKLSGSNVVVDYTTFSTRPCKLVPDSLLPQPGCIFLPTSPQPAGVSASIMSHQYVEGISTFCHSNSSDPLNLHNANAPNEQNRLCQMRSTWDVILDSKDFANGQNPVNETLLDTTPMFTVLKASPQRHVLVLDVSGSMGGTRIAVMQRAAGLFVKEFVSSSSLVGIVSFSSGATRLSDLRHMRNMTARQGLDDIIRSTTAGGSTRIGLGILEGLEVLKGVDNEYECDGNLIVLTDGLETGGYPDVSDVFQNVISCGAKMYTIFLDLNNAEANKIMANLSEVSGGSWHAATSQSSSTDIISIFQSLSQSDDGDASSTTYQIYSGSYASWPKNENASGGFTIDSTVGNHTIMTVTWENIEPAEIILKSPEGCEYSIHTNANACPDSPIHMCDSTQKSCLFTVPGTAQTGYWTYVISNTDVTQDFAVIVTSKQSNTEVSPIVVQSYFSSTDISSITPTTLYAKVSQGFSPVLNANVTATVTLPSMTSVKIQLYDDGAGPDVRKNDGIYTRYFHQFSNAGRYRVQISVLGDTSTGQAVSGRSLSAFNFGTLSKNGTFIPNANGLANFPRSPSSIGSSAGEGFERVASGGSFSYSGPDLSSGRDFFPPNNIMDLTVNQLNISFLDDGIFIEVKFTAPGDDLDVGRASRYVLKYSNRSATHLLEKFENATSFNQNDVIEGNFSQPSMASSSERFVIKVKNLDGDASQVFVAVVAYDDNEQASGVSNIAPVTLLLSRNAIPTQPNPVTSPQETTLDTIITETPESNNTKDILGYQIGLGVLILTVLILCGVVGVLSSKLSTIRKSVRDKSNFRLENVYS